MRSDRRTVAGALVAGVLTLSASVVPAQAVVPPGCVPEAGGTVVQASTPPFAASDGVLDLVLEALDTCGQRDTGYTASLLVSVQNLDGRATPDVPVELTTSDAGRRAVGVEHRGPGLTFVDVFAADDDSYLAGTSVVVHGPEGYPVVDELDVSVTGSTYRASGVSVDPDVPSFYFVPVYLRVDGYLVVADTADVPTEVWQDAPPSVGAQRGFDLSVILPAGEHEVCLSVHDRSARWDYLSEVQLDCRTLQVPPTPAFGSLDGLYPTPRGLVGAGWAINPENGKDATALVYHSTRFTRGGLAVEFNDSPYPAVADRLRPDVGVAHPAYGAMHGFVTHEILAPDGTTVQLCAGATVRLGCAEQVQRHSPLGALDSVGPVPGGVAVRGWALDLGTYGATTVHVYVDGRPTAVVTADRSRPDVSAAFPPGGGGLVPGYGPDHGFEQTLQVPVGRHTVCAYGINVEGTYLQGGSNSLLGCRNVTVVDDQPIGHLDSATPAPGGFTLRGWTADPDAPTTPLQVHTYRDGAPATITTASTTRPDLAALDGGRYGTAHGFSTTVPTGPTARLCSYAINTGPGATNTTLGCRDLTRATAPTGSLDGLARTSQTGTTLRGWALDPDTASPVDVHVYVDGRPTTVQRADQARPDVAAVFPGWGPGHGYTLSVPATPGQRVCIYAINSLQGSSNTTLGCQTA